MIMIRDYTRGYLPAIPTKFWVDIHKNALVAPIDYNNSTFMFLEYDLNSSTGETFINTYNFLTRELVHSMPLMDSSNIYDAELAEINQTNLKTNQIIQANRAKADAATAAYLSTPQGQISQKLAFVYGDYFYNYNNKNIYYLNRDMQQPDKIKDNLVRLENLHFDPKQKLVEFDYIDNLKNAAIYKKINGKKKCSVCHGQGYTTNTYTRTVADYEYTYVQKL